MPHNHIAPATRAADRCILRPVWTVHPTWFHGEVEHVLVERFVVPVVAVVTVISHHQRPRSRQARCGGDPKAAAQTEDQRHSRAPHRGTPRLRDKQRSALVATLGVGRKQSPGLAHGDASFRGIASVSRGHPQRLFAAGSGFAGRLPLTVGAWGAALGVTAFSTRSSPHAGVGVIADALPRAKCYG